MLHRIAGFIARHRMFAPSHNVGVAVSGGADSIFLLHILRDLAPDWNLNLSVIHIEHGIRGRESLADAEFVAQLASSFGLPFHLHHAAVPSIPGNLEQAARNVRQAFYSELIATGAVDRIATGHTRSDQAETVLYRILRGSGLTGLSGILPVTAEGLVRPLLTTDRRDIECWLREHGIPWREDETNRDLTYARNRLRHEILPLLRESFNPELDAALSILATLARDEETYWISELARRQPPATSHQPLVLPLSALTGPPALARRILRRAIEVIKGDLRSIDFAHIERILDMAHAPGGHGRFQAPGLDICRSFDWIRISPASPSTTAPTDAFFSVPLDIPGSVELPGLDLRIRLQVLQKIAAAPVMSQESSPRVTLVNELDWQRLCPAIGAPSLELRYWRPGDQYRRIGQSKPEKIKFLFQKARIPLWERALWPIITYNGNIVWARRFGAAADFAVRPETRTILQVGELEHELSNPSDPL